MTATAIWVIKMYYYYYANDCVRPGCRFEIAFVDRNPGRAMRGTLRRRRLIACYRRVAPTRARGRGLAGDPTYSNLSHPHPPKHGFEIVRIRVRCILQPTTVAKTRFFLASPRLQNGSSFLAITHHHYHWSYTSGFSDGFSLWPIKFSEKSYRVWCFEDSIVENPTDLVRRTESVAFPLIVII